MHLWLVYIRIGTSIQALLKVFLWLIIAKTKFTIGFSRVSFTSVYKQPLNRSKSPIFTLLIV